MTGIVASFAIFATIIIAAFLSVEEGLCCGIGGVGCMACNWIFCRDGRTSKEDMEGTLSSKR